MMHRRLSWIMALCLITALSARPGMAADAPPPVVSGVRITGLVNLKENALRESLKLKPGAPFSAAQMEADRKALLALGFFRSVTAAQRMENGQAEVTFRVVEWPQVAEIRVGGNTVVERDTILQVISTQVGQVLCGPQLKDDVHAIEQVYRERGYVGRVSETLLDEAAKSGVLRFEILEVRIDDVQVVGGAPALREKCREKLVQIPGDLYQPELVSMDQRRLLRVRHVRRAEPKVETTAPGKVRIRWLINTPRDGSD
jgi:outer membrane protein assembly factor BamA